MPENTTQPTVKSILDELKTRLTKPSALTPNGATLVRNGIAAILILDEIPHNPEVDETIKTHVPAMTRMLDNLGVTEMYFMMEWSHLTTYYQMNWRKKD